MSDLQARIRLPRSVRADEAFTIRTLVNHPMVSGLSGENPLPRDVLARFICQFEGAVVLDMRFGAGIAANPFFEFDAAVPGPGVFRFEWHHEDGSVHVEEAAIDVG